MAYLLNPSFIARYGVYNERKQNSINRSDSRKHRKQFLVRMNSVCVLRYSKNVFLLSPMSGSFLSQEITQHKITIKCNFQDLTEGQPRKLLILITFRSLRVLVLVLTGHQIKEAFQGEEATGVMAPRKWQQSSQKALTIHRRGGKN